MNLFWTLIRLTPSFITFACAGIVSADTFNSTCNCNPNPDTVDYIPVKDIFSPGHDYNSHVTHYLVYEILTNTPFTNHSLHWSNHNFDKLEPDGLQEFCHKVKTIHYFDYSQLGKYYGRKFRFKHESQGIHDLKWYDAESYAYYHSNKIVNVYKPALTHGFYDKYYDLAKVNNILHDLIN